MKGILPPRKIGCLLVLILVLASSTAEARQGGVIAGSVRDATDAPLAGATITLKGTTSRTATSGDAGEFEFGNLQPGDYTLTVVLTAFATATRSVRLTAGQRVFLVVPLTVQIAEETYATASRTGESSVHQIPMAVTVVPGTELRRAQARTVRDLAGRAPTVTFSQNAGFAQLTIRGIGTNVVFSGSDPSSAVYVDGVYLARPAAVLADFLDLERVEVLRGPQGTLYGRNAMGGALNLITRDPTDALDAEARFVVGNLDELRAEARVSGALIGGRLMGSAAVLRGFRGGFVRDLSHPEHPLGADDVTAGRAKLHWVINRRSDLLVSTDFAHQDAAPLTYAKVLAVKPGYQVDSPADLHDVRTSTLAEGLNVQYGGAARLRYRLDPRTTLTSLSAYRKMDYELVVDADITELDLTVSHVHEMQHQVTEELTVSRASSGLTWIVGLFLLDELDRQPTVVTLGEPRLENHLEPSVEADSRAVFGQATVDVMPRVSATAGLRYTHERKNTVNAGRLNTLDPPFVVLPGTSYHYSDAISHAAWTPRFGVDVQIGDATMGYASASRGFKSGGFNITAPEPGRGYAPETAWSYEVGLKTLAGRSRLSMAAFHSDYRNLQVQTPLRPGVIDISNAAAATIRGLELEMTTDLSPVRVGGHLAWLRARYDRYVAVGVGGIIGDVAGRRLNNAPDWSGRLWAEWTRGVARAGTLSCRLDSVWQSVVFFTPFNDGIQRQTPYGLLDASAELRPGRGPWSLGVYARNLTSEDHVTATFGTSPAAFGGRPGPPRQFGVQFTLGH